MSGPARDLLVSGGLCLLPGRGLVEADIVCAGGHIAEIRPPRGRGPADLDASGCIVLPGVVDIHGDAFERQIMPRPGTMFPLEMALLDTDRQLVANGITTAYHGITISWEPGLRSLAQAMEIIAALDRLEPLFHADNRLHIRWETFALDEMGAVKPLLERRKKPLLAFNDHTMPVLKASHPTKAIARHAERARVDTDHYTSLLEQASTRAARVPVAIRTMARAASRQGVAMLSHDDRSPEERAFFRALGVTIAEFPVTADTLDASAAAGDMVVLGAPNVVRGGSHNGAIGAAQAVAAEKCAILASDYYYPAPLRAALMLDEQEVLPLERAWELVSSAPAQAAGLVDRGRIGIGLRADLVVVCGRAERPVATIAGGQAVYRSR